MITPLLVLSDTKGQCNSLCCHWPCYIISVLQPYLSGGKTNREQREGISTTDKWMQTKSKPEGKSNIKGEMRDWSGGCLRNLAEDALVWGLKKPDI